MTSWKEKFYIGSQWKTREGGRAMVIEHCGDGFFAALVPHRVVVKYHNCNGSRYSGEVYDDLDLIEPWKGQGRGD